MSNQEISLRLFIALLLGAVIGFERIYRGHEAGVRTHSIVAMGSALFILAAISGAQSLGADYSQVLRVFSQIVSGIGFLGAGLIFMSEKENKKKGLTSAATLWMTSAIGAACGFGLVSMASIATFLTLFTLTIVSTFEWAALRLFKK
jgi:putative Mg2+ transporter-C (MgtC) family protein